jgi:hypothetical protein
MWFYAGRSEDAAKPGHFVRSSAARIVVSRNTAGKSAPSTTSAGIAARALCAEATGHSPAASSARITRGPTI